MFKKIWDIINIVWLCFFSGYLIYLGVGMPPEGRLRLGLLLVVAAALFGTISQVGGIRRKFYAAQMDFYRKKVSEDNFQRNGAMIALALGTSGAVLLALAGREYLVSKIVF